MNTVHNVIGPEKIFLGVPKSYSCGVRAYFFSFFFFEIHLCNHNLYGMLGSTNATIHYSVI